MTPNKATAQALLAEIEAHEQTQEKLERAQKRLAEVTLERETYGSENVRLTIVLNRAQEQLREAESARQRAQLRAVLAERPKRRRKA